MIRVTCEGGPLDGAGRELACPAPEFWGKKIRTGILLLSRPDFPDGSQVGADWTRYELDEDLVYRPAPA